MPQRVDELAHQDEFLLLYEIAGWDNSNDPFMLLS